MLYRSFCLDHSLGYGPLDPYDWKSRLFSFIRTVSRRRDLAALVYEASIFEHLIEDIVDDTDTWDTLQEATQSLGIDMQVAWKQRALEARNPEFPIVKNVLLSYAENHSGSGLSAEHKSLLHSCLPGEIIAVLIALLPNLSYLSLLTGHRPHHCMIPRFALQSLGISNLPLKALDTNASFLHILSLLDLATNIETLNIHNTKLTYGWIHSRPDDWEGLDNAGFSLPPLSSLKTLRAPQCSLNVDYLGMIMSRCTGGLESFLYEEAHPGSLNPPHEMLGSNDHAPPPIEVGLAKVFRHIFSHRKSIRSLRLDFRYGHWESGAVPSLGEFSSLEDLYISSRSWYNWTIRCPEIPRPLTELLPSKIRSLCLVNCVRVDIPRLTHEFVGLIEAQQRQPRTFPKLQTIICDKNIVIKNVLSNTKSIEESFSDAGVDFRFESVHLK